MKKTNTAQQYQFPYEWNLSDSYPAKGIHKNGYKVFSCFACGGGSTMGYKLAGADVIGCNEIDPKMMKAYRENHDPKYSYLEPIQTFKLRQDLPKELYNLDILDGSPPCSSFSTAGNRDRDWGKEKKFREGQVKQVLDTLFFDFIDLAEELQPKVIIAENVKGLTQGKANKYLSEIMKAFDKAGYYAQYWILDASLMGVPQRRERVFFVCLRKDLAKPFLYQKDLFNIHPKIDLRFNQRAIPFSEIQEDDKNRVKLKGSVLETWKGADDCGRWDKRSEGGKKLGYYYTARKNLVCATILAGGNTYAIEERPERLNKSELCKIGSYPLDYNFIDNKPQYLIGMSVPPVMIAQIATQVFNQWLSKI